VLWQDGVAYDLGTLRGESSTAFAINNRGQVVGQSETAAGETHAFLWEDGVMRDLGTLGGAFTFSVATSINNRGQVVGENVTSQGHSRAFLWQDGVTTPLDESEGSSSAHGINPRGDIAGQILPAGAVLWTR
jgi:probable HAF family extracellular repeat protein